MLETIRKLGRLLTPPIISKPLGQLVRGRELPTFERVPEGWAKRDRDGVNRGWNREGIIAAERERWNAFRQHANSIEPLGFSHEAPDTSTTRNIAFHNIHLTFGFVLALAAHNKTSLRVLDWGGGLGHYYLVGKALLPEVQLNYHIHEVPLMSDEGSKLCPEVHFCSDDSCLEASYDLVMLNGSLGYFPDWKDTLEKLCSVAESYLLLTRLFVVEREPTFVVLHRTSEHGYRGEMLTQVFNRDEVLAIMTKQGFSIVRELAVDSPPVIEGAHEQCVSTGWLFRRVRPDSSL